MWDTFFLLSEKEEKKLYQECIQTKMLTVVTFIESIVWLEHF